MFIPDLDLLPIPDPGVKKAPDPGSATLITSRSLAKNVVFTRNATKKFCCEHYENSFEI
jgi:hypothetical protein